MFVSAVGKDPLHIHVKVAESSFHVHCASGRKIVDDRSSKKLMVVPLCTLVIIMLVSQSCLIISSFF